MNLRELKNAVRNAIECAADYGEKPEEINVSLQIDDPENPHDDFMCVSDGVELHYDGNACASGCVLQGWLPEPDGVADTLRKNGYEVAEGADAVRQKIAEKADGDDQPRCSGYRVFPGGEKCPGCGDCRPND